MTLGLDDETIDEILDKAVDEQDADKEASRIESLEAQISDLKALVGKLPTEDESPAEEDPAVESDPLKDELQKTKEILAGMQDAMKVSAMNDMQAAYPEFFSKKELLDSPALPGASVSTREWITELVSLGDKASAEAVIKRMMQENGLEAKPSSPVTKGSAAGARPPEMTDEQAKHQAYINKMGAALKSGKLPQILAARKSSPDALNGTPEGKLSS